jgi:ribosomal protein L44E
MNHTGIVSNCANCHNGMTYAGGVTPQAKPAKHISTNLACETCHKSTTSFTGTAMNHTGITTGCATCHNGSTSATAKPANHIFTSSPCETCHKSTSTFSGTKMNHTGIVSNCANCHNGMTYAGGITPLAKPAKHISTNLGCESCHTTSTFNKG